MHLGFGNLTSSQVNADKGYVWSAIETFKRLNSPLLPKKLPNASSAKVKFLAKWHPVLYSGGIEKRELPAKLEILPYFNGQQNRYLAHQFIRLHKHLNNPVIFWTIAEHLMNRSSVYLSHSLLRVFPNWHRHKALGIIWNYLKQCRRLNLSKYKCFEQAIPKSNGKVRYLHIPTPSWRIYLQMLNKILEVWLRPYSHPSQHGYQSGKGSDSAWIDIHSHVLSSKNIYEFDLTGFFPNLNLDYLKRILLGTQIPSSLVDKIILWARTRPWNSVVDRTPWPSVYTEACTYKYHLTGEYQISSSIEVDYWKSKKDVASKSNPRLGDYDYYYGIAQGSSLSPQISVLPLVPLLFHKDPNVYHVQYADDGILYSPVPFSADKLMSFPAESGISQNSSKSGWVKRDGTWLNSLTFLGKRYTYAPYDTRQHQGGLLSNATRNSKDFIFTKYQLIIEASIYDYSRFGPHNTPHQSWHDWFRTSYFGSVSSMIYAGTYSLSSFCQDFTYTFSHASWADQEDKRRRLLKTLYRLNGHPVTTPIDIFNSSSLAQYSISKRISYQLKPRAVDGFTSDKYR